MAELSVQQMAANVGDLMERRLRVKGPTLAVQLRKAGRLLPRKPRKALAILAEAERLAGHPKGAMMVDRARVTEAYQLSMAHLKAIGAKERFRAAALNFAGTLGLMVLVLGGGVIAVMAWRGLI